jgi:cysteine sulfinate desulfinase/cysteine desulfurase-like protein
LRMSLGHTTRESDVDRAISALVGVVRQLRRNKVKA